MSRTLPDTLPISSLNALEYCPRRFYYQFVQADSLVNEFVLEGTILHRRVHQQGTRTIEGEPQMTRLYLCSETLRLSGYADVIEEREGLPVPIEYKHGKQGIWLNDAIQLCAQAFCLEELLSERSQEGTGVTLLYGYIYYAGSQRRVRVNFTETLRARTRATIEQALLVATREEVPPPLDSALARRCINCSLKPLCLPDEVKRLQSQQKGA